jgi:hypothetical protein
VRIAVHLRGFRHAEMGGLENYVAGSPPNVPDLDVAVSAATGG